MGRGEISSAAVLNFCGNLEQLLSRQCSISLGKVRGERSHEAIGRRLAGERRLLFPSSILVIPDIFRHIRHGGRLMFYETRRGLGRRLLMRIEGKFPGAFEGPGISRAYYPSAGRLVATSLAIYSCSKPPGTSATLTHTFLAAASPCQRRFH